MQGIQHHDAIYQTVQAFPVLAKAFLPWWEGGNRQGDQQQPGNQSNQGIGSFKQLCANHLEIKSVVKGDEDGEMYADIHE